MTVLEIVESHLRATGADGLCCDGCGCSVDDLAPCGQIGGECVPARRVTAKDARKEGHDPFYCEDDDEYFIEITA